MSRPIRVRLVCSDGGTLQTGGGRYNHHLTEAGPSHGFTVERAVPSAFRLPAGDIVVVDSLDAWRMLAAVRTPNRPPIVALVHQQPGGSDGPGLGRRVRRLADLATYRQCDLVMPTGHALADQLVARHRLDARRIRVVEPGIDHFVPADPRSPVPLRAGRHLALVAVANWWPNKGLDDIVAAVALLEPESVTLHLVGRTDVSPRYEAALRRQIAMPDLADRVVVHGPLDTPAITELLAGADAFAFSSHAESYGMAAAEAIVAGLPVVGWALPFLRRFVSHGVNGLLADPFDISALARAVAQLCADEHLRGVLAGGARRRRTQLPTWADTASQFYGALIELAPKITRDGDSSDLPADRHRRAG